MKSLSTYIFSYVVVLTMLITGLSITPTLAQINDHSIQHIVELGKKQGIPEKKIDNLIQRAHEKNLSDEEITAILQPAIEMASHNLPFDLVIRKSLEGIAKGVNPALILKVEEKMQSDATDAAQLTDEWISKPAMLKMIARSGETHRGNTYRNKILTTITGVLFQGTSHEELRRLLDDMANNDVAPLMNANQASAAIESFPGMPTSNHYPKISRDLIIEAIREHFTPKQIQQLPIAMTSGVQLGGPAAVILSGITSKKMNDGSFASIVLQELFEGNFRGGPSNGIPPGLENPHARNERANGNGMNNHGNGRNGKQ